MAPTPNLNLVMPLTILGLIVGIGQFTIVILGLRSMPSYFNYLIIFLDFLQLDPLVIQHLSQITTMASPTSIHHQACYAGPKANLRPRPC